MPDVGASLPSDQPTDLYTSLAPPIAEVWTKIKALIDSEIEAAITTLLRTSTNLTTVAVTVGTPGVPLVANPLVPWATVVVPFPAVWERLDYFGANGHPCQIDVRIIRPGQTVPDGATAIPGGPPTFDVDIARFLAGPGTGTYIEPDSALAFYVDSVDGAECVTCNVILRCL